MTTPARIGIGGMERNVDAVLVPLKRTGSFTIESHPSLKSKVLPWTLLYRIWRYLDDVDLYYGISYGQWPRYLIAKLRGRKVVCHWAGTDVLRVLHRPLHRWWFQLVIRRCIDRHLVVSENLGEELRTIGVESQYIPLISGLVKYNLQPLPEEFAWLVYLPAHRGDFYGAPLVYEAAACNPQWPVYIVGRDPTPRGQALANVYELGKNVDMTQVYPKVSVLVRPTVHDGLPRMILEALSWGRYVIFSRQFPYCEVGQNTEEIEKILSRLSRMTSPNEAGARYVQEEFNEEYIVSQLSEVFVDLLNSQV